MIVATTDEIQEKHQKKIFDETGEKIHVYPGKEAVPQAVAQRTEILVMFGSQLTDAHEEPIDLSRFPNLRWIQMLSAGVDDLPLDEVRRRNIIVTNVSGIHANPMSEYVVLAMLYFEKDWQRYFEQKRKKIWDRSRLAGELYGREVLIYGTGHIGQAIAQRLQNFHVQLYGVNTSGRPVPPFSETYSLAEAAEKLQSADYVVSVLPSTARTRKLFSASYLRLMKKEAVFISIGRGDVVDESAVVQMVREGKLKGAVFDVFETEPLPQDSPLWECENIILTPHMSAKSIYYIDRCIEIFIKNLQAFKEGRPMINVVDVAKGY